MSRHKKLSLEQRMEVRRLFAQVKRGRRWHFYLEQAQRFNVSFSTIQRVVLG